MYFQLAFALDRVRALAPQNPGWKDEEPFRTVLAGDPAALAKLDEKALLKIVARTHSGMTPDEFQRIVTTWLAEARHPQTGRRYDEMVYQPMLELLAYLRANGFKTFIVSGGGADFMRAWVEQAYGIPAEQVVGSRGVYKLETRDGAPVLIKTQEIDHIDDGPGKPVGIQQLIGRRSLLAFGNSDGDLEMLQWTTAAAGPHLGLLLHHDDPQREFAYDRESHIGRLAKGLDQARERGWTVASMKEDWSRVFPAAAR
jgi:phosphoserine phosphatase